MPVYLEDPSVLTKDKLKNELLAHNVELPSGNPTKDVLVQLYLDNVTVQDQHDTAAFSSDEELPPVVVTSRSRSSGRVSLLVLFRIYSSNFFSFTEFIVSGARFSCTFRDLHMCKKQSIPVKLYNSLVCVIKNIGS